MVDVEILSDADAAILLRLLRQRASDAGLPESRLYTAAADFVSAITSPEER
jgi:hypothetical protein